MTPQIDHIIVLMMENRSFDHMLGFANIPGLVNLDPAVNWNPVSRIAPEVKVPVTSNGKTFMSIDPDHSHAAVMLQLLPFGQATGAPHRNTGFVESYEAKGGGATVEFRDRLRPYVLGGIGASLASAAWSAASGKPGGVALSAAATSALLIAKKKQIDRIRISSVGTAIMDCQSGANLPALAALAKSFVVCDRWFCSVPGETWPNRLFAHAGTSDDTVANVPRPYTNQTIFDLLADPGDGSAWRVYHDGIPQVFCFPKVLAHKPGQRDLRDFITDCATGDLPRYSFLEPNHGFFGSLPRCSQHPANNLYHGDGPPGPTAGKDFTDGDALIASVYEALRNSKGDLFARSLLIITYDEHGGTYDREPPPSAIPPFPGALSTEGHNFKFDMLGPRVPAVIVSPHMSQRVVHTLFDHTSIPRTVRDAFGIDTPGDDATLLDREAAAASLLPLLDLADARADVPDLSSYTLPELAGGDDGRALAPPPPTYLELSDFQRSLIELAYGIRQAREDSARALADPSFAPEPSAWPTSAQRASLATMSGEEIRDIVDEALR